MDRATATQTSATSFAPVQPSLVPTRRTSTPFRSEESKQREKVRKAAWVKRHNAAKKFLRGAVWYQARSDEGLFRVVSRGGTVLAGTHGDRSVCCISSMNAAFLRQNNQDTVFLPSVRIRKDFLAALTASRRVPLA